MPDSRTPTERLVDELSRQLAEWPSRAVSMRAAVLFIGLHERLADTLAESGSTPRAEAEATATEVVFSLLDGFAGAAEAMVSAMTRAAAAAACATRH